MRWGWGERIAKRLRDISAQRGQSDWLELPARVAKLIRSDSFAFLVAVCFDNGLKWRRVAAIPYEIHRRGFLDPAKLAAMTEPQIRTLLKSLPAKPRWGAAKGARTISEAAKLVQEEYAGDASNIWRDSSVQETQMTLRRIHGVGPNLANMATRILHDEEGHFRDEARSIDVKADSHLLRVFQRTGLTSSQFEEEAKTVARRLNPRYPAELDWGAWHVGRTWCNPSAPKCGGCPLDDLCLKHL